jgi:PAS domain S-box-containing protein
VEDGPEHAEASEQRLQQFLDAVDASASTTPPLRDPSSQPDGTVDTPTSSSEQAWAAESQAIANAVLESSTDAIVTFDRDLLVTRINSAAARSHPLPATELVGRPYFEVFDVGPARETIERRLRAVLAGAAVDVEYTPDVGDTSLVFAVRAFPIRGADGAVIGGAVMGRDIT